MANAYRLSPIAYRLSPIAYRLTLTPNPNPSLTRCVAHALSAYQRAVSHIGDHPAAKVGDS